MIILKYMMRGCLYLRYLFHKLSRTGSFGIRQARPVPLPYRKTGNRLKDGLFRHHVKQFHESSCSVASVAGVANTLMEHQGRLKGPPVTQQQLLDRIRTAHWKERMSADGYKGRRGLPLDVLGRVVESSLTTLGIDYEAVEVVRARRSRDAAPAIRKRLLERLRGFDTKGDGIIIAHFDQGSFVPELNIPHISPVGGFDPATGQITLLDVDPSQAHPYQISFNTFYKGISTDYLGVFRHYGYGRGGYVYIRLPKNQASLT